VLSFPFNKSATSSTFRGLMEELEENLPSLDHGPPAERRAVGKRKNLPGTRNIIYPPIK
jgi:hypothetical protein